MTNITQAEVSVICWSQAEADNTDGGVNTSDILQEPNSIILLCFIPQEKNSNFKMYLSSSKFDLDRYEIYFVCAEAHIIICGLLTNENTGI